LTHDFSIPSLSRSEGEAKKSTCPRLARRLNTLARFSKDLAGLFSPLGVRAAIGLIRNTLTGPWLDPAEIAQRLSRPFRLRWV